MAYSEISVVVDGALEETVTFTDYAIEEQWLADLEKDATSHGYRTEVFRLYHEHDPCDDGCECIQYEQDHHPYRTFN